MCHQSCIDFGNKFIKEDYVKGKTVIEVGACQVNGSLRSIAESFRPYNYIGVDIKNGPGVDLVCNAENLIDKFGYNKFDIVICSELLEHVRNWKKVIHNLKQILRPDGILIITTRSRGTGYHAFPCDYWRYEISDMKALFSDFNILVLESDPSIMPGVFFIGMKPGSFHENKLNRYNLFSILTGIKTPIFLINIYGLICYKIRTTIIGSYYYIGHLNEISGMIKRKIDKTHKDK